jgi:hypothetical protein
MTFLGIELPYLFHVAVEVIADDDEMWAQFPSDKSWKRKQ